MLFKSKKASLELSIRAIVIVVLAMTLLGLGLAFIKGMFGDITKISDITFDKISDQLQRDLINSDEKLAKNVIFSDSEADKFRNLIQDELIKDYMSKDASTATRAVPLLLIARHLERICDHATNIAEDVIYMVQAKVVKHHPENI